jgi:hypothetical protein
MKKLIVVAVVVTALAIGTRSVHAQAGPPGILIIGVGDNTKLTDLSGSGWIVRAGVACPIGIKYGIYGGAAGNGSGEHPVGCVVMQRP